MTTAQQLGAYQRDEAHTLIPHRISPLRWLGQKIVRAGRMAKAIGLLQYLHIELLTALRVSRTIHINAFDADIGVRTGTPDLDIAIACLTHEFDCLDHLLPPSFDGLIIDGGGYIGTAAIAMARLYPNATIVSVEASTANFKLLKQNVAAFPNIVPLHAALTSSKAKTVPLYDCGGAACSYTTVKAEGRSKRPVHMEDVSAITISDIRDRFPSRPIGILKLDIEGGERDLFTNAREEIDAIPVVFAELHDSWIPGCMEAFDAFSQGRWVVFTGGEKYLSLARAA